MENDHFSSDVNLGCCKVQPWTWKGCIKRSHFCGLNDSSWIILEKKKFTWYLLDRIYTDLRHMSSWEGDGAIPVDMKKLNGIWAQKHLLALRVYFELFSASSFYWLYRDASLVILHFLLERTCWHDKQVNCLVLESSLLFIRRTSTSPLLWTRFSVTWNLLCHVRATLKSEHQTHSKSRVQFSPLIFHHTKKDFNTGEELNAKGDHQVQRQWYTSLSRLLLISNSGMLSEMSVARARRTGSGLFFLGTSHQAWG